MWTSIRLITAEYTMDIFGIFIIPNFLVWILLIAFCLYLYGTWSHSYLAGYGHKGPPPKPFMGNVDLIISSGFFGSTDLPLKQIYGKVFSMYEGPTPSLVVFDRDVLKEILVKDFGHFTDRRDMSLRGKLRYSLLDLKGDEWKRVRNLNTPFFTTGKLRQHIQLLDHCVNNIPAMLQPYADKKEPFEAKEFSGAFSLEAICLTAFGIKVDSMKDPNHPMLVYSKKLITELDASSLIIKIFFSMPFLARILDKCGVTMWPKGSIEYFTEVVRIAMAERLKSNEERQDFVQAMIRAHEAELDQEAKQALGDISDVPSRGKALTEDEIVAQASVFIIAGYETTSAAISFLLFNLAYAQECQDRVYQEINDVIGNEKMTYETLKQLTYLDMCLSESMRLYPGILRNDRKCGGDVTINGYHIPKDVLIIIPIYALHHDPEIWDDPERFDPERFSPENKKNIDPYTYLPFGQGPRHCIGMRLAQAEVKMAIVKIIQSFKVTVDKKTQLPPKLAAEFNVKLEGGVWLQVENRQDGS